MIKAGPKLELQATNVLGEGEQIAGYSIGPAPAISAGRMSLRRPKALRCIGKP